MSKPKLISPWHKQLLQLILQNKYVVNNILMGDKLVGNIEINDDGSIRYYTKSRWFKWLCILFGDYKDLSFRELVLTLIDIISGPNNQMNSKVFDGMTKEFMENAVRSQKYDYIIDMLFDVLRFGTKDGEYASQYLHMSGSQSPERDCNDGNIGNFRRERCHVILNSGEIVGDVEVFTRVPRQVI